MPSYELILRKDGQNVSRFRVGDKAVIIGRASDSDIVLPDRMISRRHARLQVVDDLLTVEDLGSTNGIVVNGKPVRQYTVQEGDEIFLAKYNVLVERSGVQQQLSDTGAFISFDSGKHVLDRIVKSPGAERLAALYRASALVGQQLEVDALMKSILDIIFDALPVGRGFIMTRPDDSEEPEIRVSRFKGKETRNLPLSQTLMDYVFLHRTSVLTTNAKMDDRFDDSKSIFDFGIESAMCVPLAGHGDIVGAIYVDGDSEAANFTQDDLELLTAVGRVVGVAVENTWLTEERVQRARMAALGEALSGISHCMRNMLQGVKIAEECLDENLRSQEWDEAQKDWGSLRHHLGRFDKLVHDLLSFSREEKAQPQEVDFDSLVAEAFSTLRNYADKAGVALEQDDESFGICYCDRQHLFRILLNLIMNGVDACAGREDGRVRVWAWRNKFGVYVEVEDNGAGIEPEHMPKVAQAFFTTKGSRGTGLGLACSNRLVEAHGGKMMIDSEPGKGSRFTVFLPAKDAVAPDESSVTVQV
jgi:two-component system NtrC family sensor kinase